MQYNASKHLSWDGLGVNPSCVCHFGIQNPNNRNPSVCFLTPMSHMSLLNASVSSTVYVYAYKILKVHGWMQHSATRPIASSWLILVFKIILEHSCKPCTPKPPSAVMMFMPFSPLGPWKRTGTHRLAKLPLYPALVLQQKFSKTDVNRFKQLMSVRLTLVPCISSRSMAPPRLLRPAHRYVSKPRCWYSLPPQWALSPRPPGFHVAHLLSVASLRLAERGWTWLNKLYTN